MRVRDANRTYGQSGFERGRTRLRTPIVGTGGCLLIAASTACIGSASGNGAGTQEAMNTLSSVEREAGWRLLFDGTSLDGWRGYNRSDLPGGWEVRDGTLARTGPGGDIVTEEQFEDFELRLEWRISPGGNSGIFYRAAEGEEWMYHSAPEYQILDNERHPDGESPLTGAGANYGLHPAPADAVRPVGDWNETRIVVDGDRVEHWLNGTRIVSYVLGSPDWQERVAASKFSEWPSYGRAERGHIGLQDHGDPVWYRNVKIRVIE